MDKKTSRQKNHRLWSGLILGLCTLTAGVILSCSGNGSEPAETKKQNTKTESSKLQWTDMILKPTDTTQHQWMEQLDSWPATPPITWDSAGLAHLDDLTFAFTAWAFKSVPLQEIPEMSGCMVSIVIAARHVPEYQVIKDFVIDSALVFEQDQTTPAGRRTLFASKRKYLETVWQVTFVTQGDEDAAFDFPEGTLLHLKAYATWLGKTLIFDLPPVTYEYITENQTE